jgi:MRG
VLAAFFYTGKAITDSFVVLATNSYSFERHQYIEVREGIAKATPDFAGKGLGDIYGAEHLSRLLGNVPFPSVR